jgi:hypothetical protein
VIRTPQRILPAEAADEWLGLRRHGGRPGRERQRQNKREAVVCQRFTVSGFIRCTRSSHPCTSFERITQRKRKAGVNWRRRLLLPPDRFSSTASWLSAASTRAASIAFGNSSAQQKPSA